MGFASFWLEKSALFPQFIPEEPDLNTGIVTVVPAYNEPDITVLLDSLLNCHPPKCRAEVLIVVNAPPSAKHEHLINNKISIERIVKWKIKNKPFFDLYYFETPPLEGWGVGMARKSGMDEALRRFDKTGNANGVILSVDADCTVEQGYFRAVESELLNKKNRSACSIYFEHKLTDSSLPEGIAEYELHLRYFVMGLKYAGYPYPFHTVGSSMAVKALPYLKAGGMNRRQAGEDFYFIQKLVGAGGYFNLVSTTVYPSSRTSFRVPFGTGATMEKLSASIGKQLLTYNAEAFCHLKYLFGQLDVLYDTGPGVIEYYEQLSPGMKSFMPAGEFTTKVDEIRKNTSGLESFKKRFYGWFNMFKIIKFLNHIHMGYLEKKPVAIAANDLLALNGDLIMENEAVKLLDYFRSIEKNSVIAP